MKLGILLSGSGRTLLNLNQHIKKGSVRAEIRVVISSSRKCLGVERAKKLGIPVVIMRKRKSLTEEEYSHAITQSLEEHHVDLVVLAGFLKKYLPSKHYENSCINIHPSLIPAFCGPGFYGSKVHQAVWRRGCTVSGCTVHFVNEQYDAGPIILQKTVCLHAEDSPELIAQKVFEKECEALPEAIQLIIEKKVHIIDGRVHRKTEEEPTGAC
ncbi:MAG: phosphoribosylglycinamide formyltransferase [Acidobacteria bacterium]|nr:MAG: phosphoribosylglycinamide formyltransferase [Acidobacteriota bacterium]PIE89687.1 MAG: phosphoribosylglycinamide formyltransferase [Acidobacteriota bacterium]